RVIPKAVMFDNGSPFKGRLLSAFCEQVDVCLIHAAVHHPQTNGKLERAFRDDMRDFYKRYDTWLLDRLRRDLPDYVYYRNHIRGITPWAGTPLLPGSMNTRTRRFPLCWNAWGATPAMRLDAKLFRPREA